MNKLLIALPTLCVSAFMTAGYASHFDPVIVRWVGLPLVALLVLGLLIKRGQSGLSAIDLSLSAYVALATAVFWLAPAPLAGLLAARAIAALFMVMFLGVALPPLLGGRPFTEYFAKKDTPPEIWETELFQRINRHMTAVWAGLFAVCLVSSLIPSQIGGGVIAVIVFQAVVPLCLLVGFGIRFNKWYPAYCQRKAGLTVSEDGSGYSGGAALARTCDELLCMMPLGFNAQAAPKLEAVIQFEVSGDEEFSGHLSISGGRCTYQPGPAKSPDLTINTPAQVWLGISQGRLNGQEALMKGLYSAKGELSLLMCMDQLFTK